MSSGSHVNIYMLTLSGGVNNRREEQVQAWPGASFSVSIRPRAGSTLLVSPDRNGLVDDHPFVQALATPCRRVLRSLAAGDACPQTRELTPVE